MRHEDTKRGTKRTTRMLVDAINHLVKVGDCAVICKRFLFEDLLNNIIKTDLKKEFEYQNSYGIGTLEFIRNGNVLTVYSTSKYKEADLENMRIEGMLPNTLFIDHQVIYEYHAQAIEMYHHYDNGDNDNLDSIRQLISDRGDIRWGKKYNRQVRAQLRGYRPNIREF